MPLVKKLHKTGKCIRAKLLPHDMIDSLKFTSSQGRIAITTYRCWKRKTITLILILFLIKRPKFIHTFWPIISRFSFHPFKYFKIDTWFPIFMEDVYDSDELITGHNDSAVSSKLLKHKICSHKSIQCLRGCSIGQTKFLGFWFQTPALTKVSANTRSAYDLERFFFLNCCCPWMLIGDCYQLQRCYLFWALY